VLRVFFKETNKMKMYVLLTAAIMFGMVAPVFAVPPGQPGDLHGDVGITYDTLYVWRGFVVYGADSAIHPFINLDLFGSGFHIEVVDHRSNGGGNVNGTRDDYSVYYAGAVAPDEMFATMYRVGYRYFNYPQMSARHSDQCIDLQEMYVGFAFPKILGVKGLVPGYAIIKAWPSMHDTAVGGGNTAPNGAPARGAYEGWAHVLSLDYALPLEGITAETPKQNLDFHIETVYNNHVDPRPYGNYASSDWTHVMFGVSTDFDLGNNFVFTPGIWHQITMEDDSNRGVSPDHDINWATLTAKYKF
jgi:hypothetical protein